MRDGSVAAVRSPNDAALASAARRHARESRDGDGRTIRADMLREPRIGLWPPPDAGVRDATPWEEPLRSRGGVDVAEAQPTSSDARAVWRNGKDVQSPRAARRDEAGYSEARCATATVSTDGAYDP